MKIKNRTHWNTRDIRRLATRIGKEEITDAYQWRRLQLEITYASQQRGPSGAAVHRGYWCRIRLPRDHVESEAVAMVLAHEFAHIRGLNHRDMAAIYRWPEYKTRYAWATDYPIRKCEPRMKSKPCALDSVAKQIIHATTMIERWRSRVKAATTRLRTWTRRLKYYQRRELVLAQSAPDETRAR